MKLIPTAFDGHSIGTGTDYDAWFDVGNRPVTIQMVSVGRRNSYGLIDSISRDGYTITLHVARSATAGVSSATFAANVKKWFDPGLGYAGLRYLKVTGDDGSTALRIGVHVTSMTPSAAYVDAIDVVMVAPKPYFEEDSATTSASNPATVTNAGNVAVKPSIALTTTNTVTRRRYTIAGSGTGGGFRQYPIKLAVNLVGLTTTNAYVYVNGVSVPFYVGDGGLVTSYIWVRVDVASDGTTTVVDLVFGAAIDNLNSLCNTLDSAGMDWTSTGSDNSTWQWSNINSSNRPALPGCWRPAITGKTGGASGSFAMTGESSTTAQYSRYTDSTGINDADSMVLELGGAAASANLVNVSRVTTNHTAGVQSYVKYKTALTIRDIYGWQGTTNATVTANVDVTNAVQIAIGIEYTSSSPTNNGTLALALSGGSNWTLALAHTPTVTYTTSTTMDVYSGVVIIAGKSVTFNAFIVDDGTLTIAEGDHGWTITSDATDARFYGPVNRIQLTDPDQWLVLQPGNNAVSHTVTSGTLVVSWRGGFS